MATHTIPLRRSFLQSPRKFRTKKAISALIAYVVRHAKVASQHVIVGEELNELLWSRGITNPPSKVTVEVTKEEIKTDSENYTEAYVNLVGIKKKKKVDVQKKNILGKQTLKDKLSGAMSDLKGKSDVSEDSVSEVKAEESSETTQPVKASDSKSEPISTDPKKPAKPRKKAPAKTE